MGDLNLQPQEPVVDEERIRRIHEELSDLHEELDPDPLSLGPKRINNKVAKVRNMLRRCVGVELQLAEDLHWFKRSLNRQQGHYELEFQDLIAHDPHVRAGRNIQDREAVAKIRLKERYMAIRALEESVSDLEALLIVVRIKSRDIRDTQSRLKDQLKICEHELALGARWGDFRSPLFPDSPRATGADTKDIDDLIAETDANEDETTNPSWNDGDAVETVKEPAPEALAGSASSDETDNFLDALGGLDAGEKDETPTLKTDAADVNIDGLLDSL